MATIQRAPTWLVRALGLLAGQAPDELGSLVTPVVDVQQQGAGTADWTFSAIDIPNSAVPVITTILTADKTLHRLVQLSIVKVGAAGPIDFNVRSDGPSGSTATISWFEALAVAPSRNLAWAEIGAGQRYLSIPPGFTLKVRTGAMVAGDSVQVRAVVCSVSAGNKIW